MSTNKTDTLLVLLVGVAIGAGVGILYAPDKGTRTRKKLKGGIDDAKKEIAHYYHDATEDLKSKFFNAKFDLDETYDHFISDISHKADDVISFLEEKLANLKMQNGNHQNKP